MNTRTVSIALKGVAAAMGIAVVVLGIIGTLNSGTTISMLAIGLTALALESLRK